MGKKERLLKDTSIPYRYRHQLDKSTISIHLLDTKVSVSGKDLDYSEFFLVDIGISKIDVRPFIPTAISCVFDSLGSIISNVDGMSNWMGKLTQIGYRTLLYNQSRDLRLRKDSKDLDVDFIREQLKHSDIDYKDLDLLYDLYSLLPITPVNASIKRGIALLSTICTLSNSFIGSVLLESEFRDALIDFVLLMDFHCEKGDYAFFPPKTMGEVLEIFDGVNDYEKDVSNIYTFSCLVVYKWLCSLYKEDTIESIDSYIESCLVKEDALGQLVYNNLSWEKFIDALLSKPDWVGECFCVTYPTYYWGVFTKSSAKSARCKIAPLDYVVIENEELIAVCLLLLCAVNYEDSSDELRKARERNEYFKSENNKLTRGIKEYKSENKKLKNEVNSLSSKLTASESKLTKALEGLKSNKDFNALQQKYNDLVIELDNTRMTLDFISDKLNNKTALLSSSIKENKRLKSLIPDIVKTDSCSTLEEEVIISFEDKVKAISNKKVVLCGGMANLKTKLEEVGLPNITQVNTLSKCKLGSYCDIVVICTKFVSHSLCDNIQQQADTIGADCIYFNGTSIDYLVDLLYSNIN